MGNTVLLIVALALVAIWTGRLARSKGRNPWLWGGAAFALGIPTVHLLALVPLVVLMFMRGPQQQQTRPTEHTTACSRCQTESPSNSRFCINCGWELDRKAAAGTEEERQRTTASTEPVDTAEDGIADASQATRQAPVQAPLEDAPPPAPEPVPVVAQEMASPAADLEPAPEPAEPATPEAEPPARAPLYRRPVPVDAPTAAAMTERGVSLFNQGRIQESIDQFTKAIALDPNYTEAWAKRAEAYALLGRGAQAAEDRRQLDSLDTSSTSASI